MYLKGKSCHACVCEYVCNPQRFQKGVSGEDSPVMSPYYLAVTLKPWCKGVIGTQTWCKGITWVEPHYKGLAWPAAFTNTSLERKGVKFTPHTKMIVKWMYIFQSSILIT